MPSRRQFMAGSVASTGLFAAGCTVTNVAKSPSNAGTDYSNGSKTAGAVNAFIGTGGHGHTYPGATVPFGAVQLSPDTSNRGWDSCSGYHQQDGSIMGFSHTHLTGVGCADMLDVLVVPQTGKPHIKPGPLDNPDAGYRSRYNRETETASPGYYSVELTDSGVKAELSATKRAGIHRYHFPKSADGHILIDLVHGQQDWWTDQNETRVKNAHFRVIGNDTLVGGRQVFQWARGRWIFFAMKFSRPFADIAFFSNNEKQPGVKDRLDGEYLKALLSFDDAGDAPLLVKTGISAVDTDGALKNLEQEIRGFDFDWVRSEATAAWEKELSRVQFKAQSHTKQVIFSSAHYHALLAPTLFSDVDGRYRGMDNEIHELKRGEENYSTYSLWDTYRALHPFLTLTRSERVPGLMSCLVRMGQQSPAGAPIWPLQGRETDTMIGYHSASVLAEAIVKKVPGVDIQAAYEFIRQRAFVDDVHGFGLYREMHYIPADMHNEAVSRTLEFAYCDWAAAKIADAAGAHDDAEVLRKRSKYYRNVFDKSVGFVRGKKEDGSWVTPFTPDSLGHDQTKWRDFTETNSWQATFLNQHDIYNYMELFGGEAGFEAKLDALFTASSEMSDGELSDISGLIGQYAHGNEPSHHVAYLYAYCGAHYKTQLRVKQICDEMYLNAFDGLAGNEDCGQMSAWYLMSAMGLYPVDPTTGLYVFGTPMLSRVRLEVARNTWLTIEAEGVSDSAFYIQSATFNGQPYSKTYIDHSTVIKGGTLKFIMGDKPNKNYGSAADDRPPSFV